MNELPLSPAEALNRILERVQVRPTETLPHEAVMGRTLATDIISPLDLPPFDNSAMDGYAVVASDLKQAPVSLELLEIIGAGAVPTREVSSGYCLKIMTGAPMPAGADAVVMREETQPNGNSITFEESAKVGQNIRRAGSDVRLNEVVLTKGTLVRAAEWAMLASLGQTQVKVFQRPRVAIVVTGDEIVPVESELTGGQIHDSNSFALRALTAQSGAEIVAVRHVGDSNEALEAILREVAPQCDAIITSGGVSAGDFDPVRDVLKAQAEVHFWKIAMKPGKPVMFATFEGTPVFALPGNPVSVMVAFEEFVRPALLKMGGRSALHRLQVMARLDTNLYSVVGRSEFVRARVSTDADGFLACFNSDQSSGRLSTMTRANALLVIDAQTSFLPAGALVRAKLLDCLENA